MKICVIGTRGFPNIQGGVEKHCEALYPILARNNEIIVFRRQPYVIDKAASYQNIKFIDLPSTTIKGFEAVLHSFLATVCALFIKPDIVHIHNIGPAMFAPILKLFKIKVVLTYHSPNYEHEKWGRFSRRLLLMSEKIALSFSDSIIFVNKFQMEKYDDVVRRKSYYVPNGIPKMNKEDDNDYLQSLGLVPGKYIIAIGRITPEKGFGYLIDAYKRLMENEIKLVIAGSVEAESQYGENLVKNASGANVVFAGFVQGKHLETLYNNAKLFVLSSVNEGFPLVLLEAMSYGLDVLVSDIPATHLVELYVEDYFEKANVEDLTVKLRKKLSSPLKRRLYNLSDFNWEKIAEKVICIYRKLGKD